MVFKSPFADLCKTVEPEEIEGSLDCLEPGCYTRTYVGRYVRKDKLLTWTCPAGHKNSKEGFEIDE